MVQQNPSALPQGVPSLDIATAVQLLREAALRSASDPDRRHAACRLLDALSDAVVVGVLPPTGGGT